jgi:pyruvyl transferase EpsI
MLDKENKKFYNKFKSLKNTKKIIYALTPPPHLANIGDQAQVIAIYNWFKKHYPTYPIIEVDKNQSTRLLPALKLIINKKDIIFLHSGGNMADRAMWSENARRELIINFLNNKIISLPQTISFGKEQQIRANEIYSRHPDLTIIARDFESEKLAKKIFPKQKIFSIPDFVLSLNYKLNNPLNNKKALLCLRNDNESILNEKERKKISKKIPYKCTFFDTTFPNPIFNKDRNKKLKDTLDLFSSNDIIITDRFHGVIFSVLCKKPCVVLNTIDHKLRSSILWFKNIKFVKLARNIEEIPKVAKEVLLVKDMTTPNWNKEYFNKLPSILELKY